MGFRFGLKHANWIAHLLQPMSSVPPMEDIHELRHMLQDFERRFFTTRLRQRQIQPFVQRARQHLDNHPGEIPHDFIEHLRSMFIRVPWVALLIPSGDDHALDQLMTSERRLEGLVHIRPDDPGLILQLEEVPDNIVSLENIFPAFKVALTQATRWPGVLVWTRSNDAAFFEIPRHAREQAGDALHWIFSHLATSSSSFGPDLGLLHRQYDHEVLRPRVASKHGRLNIIQLSDLHLGGKIAQRRISRVQQLIQTLINELGEDVPIVPVITGDLMDTPEDTHLDAVRSFFQFLTNLGIEKPVAVLGNHDVREHGILANDFRNALYISNDRVVWHDESEVGLVCFNSVRGGNLARGSIGEREFSEVGNALDTEREKSRRYALIALLHHHPIPVERPTWYVQPWYERLLGKSFEKTDELEDSQLFLEWISQRNIAAVLHGHKHIPRVTTHGDIPIVGCGSTVGQVPSDDKGRTYMSINVISIDKDSGRISCRLRGERIPGAGLDAGESHELIYQGAMPRTRARN